jgi:hypothetical protein
MSTLALSGFCSNLLLICSNLVPTSADRLEHLKNDFDNTIYMKEPERLAMITAGMFQPSNLNPIKWIKRVGIHHSNLIEKVGTLEQVGTNVSQWVMFLHI